MATTLPTLSSETGSDFIESRMALFMRLEDMMWLLFLLLISPTGDWNKSNINHFDTQADCDAMAAIITKNFDDSYPGEAQTYRIVACRKPNGHRS